MPYWGNLAVLRTLQAEIAVQTAYQPKTMSVRQATAHSQTTNANIFSNLSYK